VNTEAKGHKTKESRDEVPETNSRVHFSRP